MRVLITGVSGFVGGHLARHILQTTPGCELHGTILEPSITPIDPAVICHSIDLKNERAVDELVRHIRPTHIYHLAAQAFVPRSFEAPWETLENNILSQLNIIQVCLWQGIKPRMLVVSSAEIYGAVRPDQLPIHEDFPLRPSSPYSVSKVAQDMLGLQYYLSHQFPIMRARPFNHFGPGQNARFVAPDFATQIARIEAGYQEAIIQVGDLSAQRDFTDVRDIVRAYRMIMDKGAPGEVYNIASGKAYSIQTLVETLLKHTSTPIRVMVNVERIRPTEIPILQGDATRLYRTTGWRPEISFEQTLLDVLNDCRQRVNQQGVTS